MDASAGRDREGSKWYSGEAEMFENRTHSPREFAFVSIIATHDAAGSDRLTATFWIHSSEWETAFHSCWYKTVQVVYVCGFTDSRASLIGHQIITLCSWLPFRFSLSLAAEFRIYDGMSHWNQGLTSSVIWWIQEATCNRVGWRFSDHHSHDQRQDEYGSLFSCHLLFHHCLTRIFTHDDVDSWCFEWKTHTNRSSLMFTDLLFIQTSLWRCYSSCDVISWQKRTTIPSPLGNEHQWIKMGQRHIVNSVSRLGDERTIHPFSADVCVFWIEMQIWCNRKGIRNRLPARALTWSAKVRRSDDEFDHNQGELYIFTISRLDVKGRKKFWMMKIWWWWLSVTRIGVRVREEWEKNEKWKAPDSQESRTRNGWHFQRFLFSLSFSVTHSHIRWLRKCLWAYFYSFDCMFTCWLSRSWNR